MPVTASGNTLPDPLTALRRSHERLVAAVEPLSPAALEGPAYPSEWSIAQTVSHIGSGSEIFTMVFEAARDGRDAPSREAYQEVWAVWDAKSPVDQAADGLRSSAIFLSRVEALSAEAAAAFRVSLYNGEQDLNGLLRTRLSEHAMHTWDVVVPFDLEAGLEPDATALLLEELPWLIHRAGKPVPIPLHTEVVTRDPDRAYTLDVDEDGPRLVAVDPDTAVGDSALRLPAEAFVRLVYGRLDAEHTPDYEPDGIDLDTLRRVFPGF